MVISPSLRAQIFLRVLTILSLTSGKSVPLSVYATGLYVALSTMIMRLIRTFSFAVDEPSLAPCLLISEKISRGREVGTSFFVLMSSKSGLSAICCALAESKRKYCVMLNDCFSAIVIAVFL